MKKKVVLVIGSASTIGKSLIPKLLDAGYFVLAQVRHIDAQLAKMSEDSGERLRLLAVDLRSDELGSIVAEAIANEQWIISGLIHLPSAQLKLEPLPRTYLDDLRSHMEVAVYSLHAIVSSLWKAIRKSEDFRIIAINTSAICSALPPKGMTPYLVSKGALTQYLRCVASELRNAKVTVNQISPDMFRSPLIDALPAYVVEQFAGGTAENNEKSNAIDPNTDIVPTIMFLLSPNARKITGANILITRA